MSASHDIALLDETLRYLRKRSLPAGRTSTLRKLMRAQRIGLGDRPRIKPRSRSRDGALVLHPTQGWRRA